MAWALVSAIKDQLSSFITSEFTSIANVKGEVQKLESKFHTIQAMLNDAEKRQVKEEAVNIWLYKLKDVSYQMDDVLDKWNTAMIKAEIEKQQKDEEEKAETSAAKKRKVWPPISIPNLFQHRDIAHKIKDLNEKLDEIDREGEMYEFVLTRGNEEVVERPRTTSFVDVSKIFGRDKVKDDLVRSLLGKGSEEEINPHVISLVGMGGIGKTTLAQLVYNHHEVKVHFEKKLWVCVSDPFDQCRVAKAIVQAFGGGDSNITELQSLLEKICELIEGRKIFLVFDDVWTEDFTSWEPFRLALQNGAPGSRIIVTTRKRRVAEMMESASIINLEELSEEDCWSVFSKLAFCDKNFEECKQIEDIGRKIAKKCKGLPLAAKTLGSLMRFKKSREEWEIVLCSSMWEFEDVERGLFAPLLLSYYDLSSPLKQCFLCCGVFPKDYGFSSDELVFMWMALGYIKPRANMEMEIIAREYFENLAIRSFFQDFVKEEDDDKIKYCKMHDIVHDFVQLMSKNECFTINSDISLGVDYKNARHLQLELLKNAKFPESIYSAKTLRTLIFELQGSYNLSTLSQHFRCLRVLTLCYEYPSMLRELPNAVGNFIHLRYLYLVNYCGDALPETICNLCNLQILHIDLVGGFQKLPQGMDKLINLRHFKLDCNIARYPNINFPRGFGRLTSLRTLNHFNVNGEDDSERCKLGELRNLNHLQGTLQINGLGKEVDQCEAMNAQLKKKINVRTLKLWFHLDEWDPKEITRGMDALVLNALEPPPNLEDLSILYYKGPTLSPWMVSLTNLKKLYFEGLLIEHLPPLGKLPALTSLTIRMINRLKKLGVEFMGIEESEKEKDDISITLFPNLITLKFYKLREWEEWNENGGEEEEDCTRRFVIMPRLQHLSIENCPKLKSLPNFLCTTPLQHLEIYHCQILEEWCKRGTGEEWPKISHIPNINFDPLYGRLHVAEGLSRMLDRQWRMLTRQKRAQSLQY
ncbi:putative disease resistance protein RGA3 [Quercus robur]|uniref:putative disease resistance protein RGA3 n=1 Tax=Quercus robur TaxID=38942 RepID=UPI002161E207|nr:putative disease resistance protein RGA3 [Quercus robur]XP_050273499.1 putative disease resistance protein RGA3 [Quercus robur]XP_050273500.1 putative disease resistance protein RGA3 [Quercus robur]XP_050273501.1 putative disease resistance protein RGA3 [Quercus robur]XP_050273503.1 putative disease resistance protein RGA3 [Quercus robur]XP_050273504.1 putative disease resistance protein RGA3 [Quercus robur]XP_050273505.1 putative disease resistance protein RGA3 [Quercus robur]XP_05027350